MWCEKGDFDTKKRIFKRNTIHLIYDPSSNEMVKREFYSMNDFPQQRHIIAYENV